jgi:hypothetical protein
VTDISASIKLSNRRFLEIVWPAIRLWIGGGYVVATEAVTDPQFAEDKLDQYGSIDLWHIIDDKRKIRGIASRIQKLNHVNGFRSFTIRDAGCFSEYERLRSSILGGFLHPEIFVQAYLRASEADELTYVAVAYVRDLISFSELSGWKDTNTQDGKEFRIIPISDFKDAGLKVKSWEWAGGGVKNPKRK